MASLVETRGEIWCPLSIIAFLNGEQLMEQALRGICGRGRDRRGKGHGQSDLLLCLCHPGTTNHCSCVHGLTGWVGGFWNL